MLRVPPMPVLIVGYLIAGVVLWFLLTFIISQVLKPLLMGTLLFPFFRKEGRLQNELRHVNQKIEERVLEDEIQRRKNTLKPEDTK